MADHCSEEQEVKKRNSKTTKKQMEFIINFLDENKILLSGKIDNHDLANIQAKWNELTNLLNSSGMGPVKPIQQWKKVVNEMKTNIKKRGREVHLEQIGTGGGPKKVKPLSEIEERFLALISKVVIEGAPVIEPGLPQIDVIHTNSTQPLQEPSIIPLQSDVLYVVNEFAENIPNNSVELVESNAYIAPKKTKKKTSKINQKPKQACDLGLTVQDQTAAMTALAISVKSLSDSVLVMATAIQNSRRN